MRPIRPRYLGLSELFLPRRSLSLLDKERASSAMQLSEMAACFPQQPFLFFLLFLVYRRAPRNEELRAEFKASRNRV